MSRLLFWCVLWSVCSASAYVGCKLLFEEVGRGGHYLFIVGLGASIPAIIGIGGIYLLAKNARNWLEVRYQPVAIFFAGLVLLAACAVYIIDETPGSARTSKKYSRDAGVATTRERKSLIERADERSLADTLPPSFMRELAAHAETIEINREDFADMAELLPSMERLKNLTLIDVAPTEHDFRAISRLGNLRSLTLRKLRIDHQSLKILASSESLCDLALDQMSLDDDSYRVLGKSPRLVSLQLSRIDVGDPQLRDLGLMPALSKLSIRDAKITGAGIETFRRLRPDVTLKLN